MKYKLLVAEDVSTERIALVNTLQKHLGTALTIIEAADGNEALMLYHQEKPDLLVLNIEMPFFSGLEIAQMIRAQNKTCAILFISDFDNFSYAQQAIALRALDYILKPYEESKLILAIEDALQHVAQQNNVPQTAVPDTSAPTGESDEESPCARISLVREDILSFIEGHYMEELSMKNVARAMNYSDAYFCKLFKQCFRVNFSAWLNEFRVEKAKEMLLQSRMSIREISLACGYTDANYFARVFKRITGQTPTEYRLSIMEKALRNQ